MTHINISANSYSSSINKMLTLHKTIYPESAYIGQEKVKVTKLDDIFAQYYQEQRVLVKIDTQGYERNVVEGAYKSLENIDFVEMEMSLRSLYEDDSTIDQIMKLMYDNNFYLISLSEGFADNEGYLLQTDGIFKKNR